MKTKQFLMILCLCLPTVLVQAQEKGWTPLPSDTLWARQFAPISGAGSPVVGDGTGGYLSGVNGVQYVGNNSKSEFSVGKSISDGSAVEKGLTPPISPAWELHLRDGVVTVGGDGYYYLTGSSGDNIWSYTAGVELWRSKDLHKWDYMGLVWDINKDADDWVKAWRKHPKRAVRAVWAPEIHYIKGNYYICFSMCPNGIGILKSSTGKPEGPYINAFTTHQPIVNEIDPTLFEDEDGSVYFTYAGARKVIKLKDDMSGFDGDWHRIELLNPDTVASHHSLSCQKRDYQDMGHEGAVLFKRNGLYYLGAADTYEGRYSSCMAISENIYGPYRLRHESIPCGGGTGFFKDHQGNWWCSFFGNDRQVHFREKIGFVKCAFRKDGRIYPAKDQPFVSKDKKKDWEKKWETVWK